MRFLLMICFVFISTSLYAEDVKRKFEIYLNTPELKYADNYEIRQSWEIRKFLENRKKELDFISDFRIIDISHPDTSHFEGKRIKSFTYRLSEGEFKDFSQLEFKDKEAFYNYIRRVILIDKFVFTHPKLREIAYRYSNDTNGVIVYQALNYREKPIEVNLNYTEINPDIGIKTHYDNSFDFFFKLAFKKDSFSLTLTHSGEDPREVINRLDKDIGLFKEVFDRKEDAPKILGTLK